MMAEPRLIQRRNAIHALLGFEGTLEQLKTSLGAFRWDSEKELVLLSVAHLGKTLEKYLGGSLSTEEVEEWANLIEGRDDIGFDPSNREVIRDVLYELANPLLTRPLTPETACAIAEQLNRLSNS